MQYRNHKGRFSRSNVIKAVMLVAAVVLVWTVCATKYVNQNVPDPLTYVAPQTVFAGETMEARVEKLKESILDRLAKCESGGRKEEDGIVILDSNDVGSYGIMQFQRKTVMYYSEMRGHKINGRDAILLALDAEKARDLARYIIFETNSGVAKDWVNCSKKHGLQTEVDVIKKLLN